MSLLNCLEFQTIDSADDIPNIHRRNADDIVLDDELDGQSLDAKWDRIIDDVRKDPLWFSFDND